MIGVFDSGYGGLSVLRHFLATIPDNYIYFGDNARVPYGNKSPELVYRYTVEACDLLFARGCRLVILACNTASALALRRIQQEYLLARYPDRRVLGVVRPIVEAAAARPDISKIGLIATRATVESGVYATELRKLAPHKILVSQATPLLVPLIEEGAKQEVLDLVLADYLAFAYEQGIEELILACTHYPLIIDDLRRHLPASCRLEDPGSIVAASLSSYISRHPELGLSREQSQSEDTLFLTSDDPIRFREQGERFLGRKMAKVEKISF